jgi:hypothetical protein
LMFSCPAETLHPIGNAGHFSISHASPLGEERAETDLSHMTSDPSAPLWGKRALQGGLRGSSTFACISDRTFLNACNSGYAPRLTVIPSAGVNLPGCGGVIE